MQRCSPGSSGSCRIDRWLASWRARCRPGYLRGADLWHIAMALYVAPPAEDIVFITLDGTQREVASALGFQVGAGWPIGGQA